MPHTLSEPSDAVTGRHSRTVFDLISEDASKIANAERHYAITAW